jgi:hypothetical protein
MGTIGESNSFYCLLGKTWVGTVGDRITAKKIRTARSPPKLSLKPSRLEGRVLNREYPERVSGLLRDCKYPVNSVTYSTPQSGHESASASRPYAELPLPLLP